ncbi:hypothetical protein BN2475_230066 [Paraburkholderia ribeironis]|uniref:Uncharacterized protein n=1 Tax=Paraburkholderia ribeironis TaxID=1247936 RepID=A0A1N7RYZ7_9BURK|nr:hypothetical protein BN2475_230066 [Paraburkholderia ribeironis]
MRRRSPSREKKARIARIRAYRNYYCHAVLMALNQTGMAPGGSRHAWTMMIRYTVAATRGSQPATADRRTTSLGRDAQTHASRAIPLTIPAS